MLLLPSCSDTADDSADSTLAPTATTTAAPSTTTTSPVTDTDAVDPVPLRLTFDGESCISEGMTELTPGPVERALRESNSELWEFLSNPMGANPNLKVRLIHGTADEAIPIESSIDFADALADRGYDVHVIPFDGGHHDMPTALYSSTINEVLNP